MENWRKNVDNISDNDIENDINLIKENFRETLKQIFSKEDIKTVYLESDQHSNFLNEQKVQSRQ